MPTLKPMQIAGYAWAAGFRGAALRTATAVALAESSGRTEVISSTGCCVGLWQINTRVHRQYTTAAMKDPAANARAAWAISGQGRNWQPWDVYKSKAYLMYVPQAVAGIRELEAGGLETREGGTWPWDLSLDTDSPAPDWLESLVEGGAHAVGGAVGNAAEAVGDAVAGPAEALGDALAFPAKVTAWISDRNNIVRLMKVIIGGGLVLVGLAVVTRPVQKQVAGVAGKAVGLVGPGKAARAAAPG
ncbi:transglycosylase SLT domain-containing protein [Planomonospora sp. ID82291]|uniref:transglycosylase SLT domain-containing protein n=1 Tax=Planomonospora sp. ID82291 TaxID=2738136 RepID=UPI0018C366A8|nr:transglycosylase SLT domain-containing protein [Planomonospora sp. ID82291]MBG0819134.1 transglycosylase SLT domain-containing protein [Planomonospora sp. ID82291]